MTPRRRMVLATAVALLAVAAGCAAHHERMGSAGVSGVAAEPGSPLLARRCGGCHAVPRPATMTAEKWLAALERMKRRMELPAAEWDTLAALAGGGTADTLAR